jgi:hypothetical protein
LQLEQWSVQRGKNRAIDAPRGHQSVSMIISEAGALRKSGPVTPRIADRVCIEYYADHEVFHLLLFGDGEQEPYAECSFTPEMLCDMIDADTERRNA